MQKLVLGRNISRFVNLFDCESDYETVSEIRVAGVWGVCLDLLKYDSGTEPFRKLRLVLW